MSRILVLTPRFPYPAIGGDKLRIHSVCRELSREHRLTLLSLCESRAELNADYDTSVFAEVHRVHLSPVRSTLQSLLAIPTSMPLQIAYYQSRQFNSLVDKLIPAHDLVLAHLIRTGEYVRTRRDVPRVLEMTDAISMNYNRVAKHRGRSLKSWAIKLENNRLRNYEQKILEDFELVTLVSEFDRDYLVNGHPSAISPARVQVAPNGVDLHQFPWVGPEQSDTIIFVGHQRTVQNQDACEYFASEVLPRIRARIPGAKFKIIGPGPKDFLRKMRSIVGVETAGQVKSVAEAAKGAFCAVCPVRMGAGVQNKVLEYFAMGLPAVTSAVGFEGLNAVAGSDVLLADSPDEMANAVIELHCDPALRARLAHNAQRLVRRYCSWERQLEPMTQEIRTLAGSIEDACQLHPDMEVPAALLNANPMQDFRVEAR